MQITLRQYAEPYQRIEHDAFDGVIGKPTTVLWPGGPSKAIVVDAQVLDDFLDGRQAIELTLEVPEPLSSVLMELLPSELLSDAELGDGD